MCAAWMFMLKYVILTRIYRAYTAMPLILNFEVVYTYACTRIISPISKNVLEASSHYKDLDKKICVSS